MRKLTAALILILSIHSLNAQLKQKLAQAIDKIEPKCIEWRQRHVRAGFRGWNSSSYFIRGICAGGLYHARKAKQGGVRRHAAP